MPRLLKDERYRDEILEQVRDPIVRGFFQDEYATWDDDYRTTAIDPVLNKIEALLAAPVVRAILGSTKSSIDFSEIMDERKIFIANLAKGSLGPGHAHLLGAMLVSGFSNAAASRSGVPRNEKRVPFFLHVDEFENFATDAFGDILAEARKMGLGSCHRPSIPRAATVKAPCGSPCERWIDHFVPVLWRRCRGDRPRDRLANTALLTHSLAATSG